MSRPARLQQPQVGRLGRRRAQVGERSRPRLPAMRPSRRCSGGPSVRRSKPPSATAIRHSSYDALDRRAEREPAAIGATVTRRAASPVVTSLFMPEPGIRSCRPTGCVHRPVAHREPSAAKSHTSLRLPAPPASRWPRPRSCDPSGSHVGRSKNERGPPVTAVTRPCRRRRRRCRSGSRGRDRAGGWRRRRSARPSGDHAGDDVGRRGRTSACVPSPSRRRRPTGA